MEEGSESKDCVGRVLDGNAAGADIFYLMSDRIRLIVIRLRLQELMVYSMYVIFYMQLRRVLIAGQYAPLLFTQAGLSGQQASFIASGVTGLVIVACTIASQFFADTCEVTLVLLPNSSLNLCYRESAYFHDQRRVNHSGMHAHYWSSLRNKGLRHHSRSMGHHRPDLHLRVCVLVYLGHCHKNHR